MVTCRYFPSPSRRFQHIHLDIVGPLPTDQSFPYVLTKIDLFTRWPKAVPLRDVTANSVAKAFISTRVCRFGAPDIITTDRGPQFESGLFNHLTRTLGSHCIRTTACHPQAYGMVKRLYRQSKTLLIRPSVVGWVDQLPLTLLKIRTSLKQDLECTAAELVYGTVLSLPADFVTPPQGSDTPELSSKS
ncbi:protein NYNRIN-like [Penaeus japonicus]|uniref:protein NYNRIN-like n=1 Tax=Penaeus japonicus TaxID=27405 RepID=UPI001C70F562|nr:protein NYNRIN-like [Penaeus japonicus]